MDIASLLIGGIIGFIVGVISWALQTFLQEQRQKRRVLTLLHRESAENLKILESFWGQVNNPFFDYPLHEMIGKCHRLAYNYLPAWSRLMWESQASLLPLLDEAIVSQMYELNQRLDAFVMLRNKMKDIFDRPENTKFWSEFTAWMKAYYHGDVNQRDEAQHGKEGLALDRKAVQLESSLLIPLWNDINKLYLSIHDSGNPIPTETEQ